METLRAAVLTALRVHPRVVQQGIALSPARRAKLEAALPPLPPFGGRHPIATIAVLDWDHRLPSQKLFLRLHVLYDETARARFEQHYADRKHDIDEQNLFPEFDVADFEELPADENYDAELTPTLQFESMRLSSPWRKEVDPELSAAAVSAVRRSGAFSRVRAAGSARPAQLGDLEAVSWMPPCESGCETWSIDVWWLTSFDGRTGHGWSFLVDVEAAEPVITHREFTVRSS